MLMFEFLLCSWFMLNDNLKCLGGVLDQNTFFFFFPHKETHGVTALRSQEFLVGRWMAGSFQQPILEKKLSCYHTALHFFSKIMF